MRAEWLRTDFRPVDKRDPVGAVLGWVRGDSKERPVVLDGHKPFGLIDARRLFGRGIRHNTHVDKVTVPVPTLSETTSDDEIALRFDTSLAPYLPVEDARGRAVGFVEAASALDVFESGPDAAMCAVNVPPLAPDDGLEVAIHAFQRTPSDRLPVVENGRLVGVLQLREAVRIIDFEDQPAGRRDFGGESLDVRRAPLRDMMEGGWSEVPASAPFDDVRERLQDRGYAFVVDAGDTLVGALVPTKAVRAARVAAAQKRGPRVAGHYRKA
jgi:CBS domain-containing protein